jgi:ABC-type arginine transport system permease subunit
MENFYKLTGPALVRLATYILPWLLGLLFAWVASQGWGVYNEATGTLTVTLSIPEIVGVAVVFLGAPTLAITALLGGFKSRVGDRPVGPA